jgi:hypothetical protein
MKSAISQRVCEIVHTFYSPSEDFEAVFYIREGETIFPDPENFPSTQGKYPGKGSFFFRPIALLVRQIE